MNEDEEQEEKTEEEIEAERKNLDDALKRSLGFSPLDNWKDIHNGVKEKERARRRKLRENSKE